MDGLDHMFYNIFQHNNIYNIYIYIYTYIYIYIYIYNISQYF